MTTSNEISLKQTYDIINNEGKVPEFLNNAYINVVENTAGKKPLSALDKDNVTFSIAINRLQHMKNKGVRQLLALPKI